MVPTNPAQSDRITLTLPIELLGTTWDGQGFLERTRTIAVSRHGAIVALNRELLPDQELVIRLPGSHKEADARVVGAIARHGEETVYGLTFLNPNVELWGLEFSNPRGEDGSVPLMVSCTACRRTSEAQLNEIEFEVFAANQAIYRFCKSCSALTVWERAEHEAWAGAVLRPGHAPGPANRRREPRAKVNLTACIRSERFDEEVVLCEDVSRGGLCFKSRKRYFKGLKFEVAMPYSPQSANNFVPARIVHCRELPASGGYCYGAQYLNPGKDDL